jgi:hypothetical protein
MALDHEKAHPVLEGELLDLIFKRLCMRQGERGEKEDYGEEH